MLGRDLFLAEVPQQACHRSQYAAAAAAGAVGAARLAPELAPAKS
jgi:hypothetical protein